jgi:hypothetical protein
MANIIGTPQETQVELPSLAEHPAMRAAIADFLPRIGKVEQEFQRIRGLLAEHSHEKLKSDHRAAKHALRNDPRKITSKALDDLEADFARAADEIGEKRRILKEALSEFTKREVVPNCLPALKGGVAAGEKLWRDLESEERAAYAKFNVAWQPSPLHRAIGARLADWRAAVERIEKHGQVGYIPPSSVLSGLTNSEALLAAASVGGRR